ncbi:FAD-dependent oxidoreductase [Paenibacillus thalictri]|uniref:FAD-dependent oxidoreductase n=1 Tax=Paenibacillus thalictri TaxID=2527873 RepID=A0A4Q9DLH7_9BACL|nr:FAD-dependent oxidoreductase [Paenibacillus thalictri]TBL73325.1 FAD-dependent oxidoreductase [Paenibacillus thalictri]
MLKQYGYDVVVVGGGATGIVAAMASARAGAKTAIVEYNGFVGGNVIPGLPLLGFHNNSGQLIVKGIAYEIARKLQEMGAATSFYMDPITSDVLGVDPHWFKYLVTKMLRDDGVDFFLHSMLTDTVVEDGQAKGVVIQNKEGTQLLAAKLVIDCSGDGDAAVRAGADYVYGRRSDNKTQVSSLVFRVGQIDFAPLVKFFREHPTQIRPWDMSEEVVSNLLDQMDEAEVFVLGGFQQYIEQAIADGVDFPRANLVGVCIPKFNQMIVVSSRVENVNPNDNRSYSNGEVTGLLQMKEVFDFLKTYAPGFEQVQLLDTAHQIGIRESRHIVGDYLLTGEDLTTGRFFDDVICLGGYHMDIHIPGQSKTIASTKVGTYEIPFSCLLPKGLDGMIVAGRPISATHEAMSSTRVIPIQMAQAEAAGTAAAMCVEQGISVRNLDIAELQKRLISLGAELGQGIGRRTF